MKNNINPPLCISASEWNVSSTYSPVTLMTMPLRWPQIIPNDLFFSLVMFKWSNLVIKNSTCRRGQFFFALSHFHSLSNIFLSRYSTAPFFLSTSLEVWHYVLVNLILTGLSFSLKSINRFEKYSLAFWIILNVKFRKGDFYRHAGWNGNGIIAIHLAWIVVWISGTCQCIVNHRATVCVCKN